MAKRFSGFWLSVFLLVALLGLASSADPPASSPPGPAPEADVESPDSAPSMPPAVPDAPSSSPPSPPPETESPPPQAPGSSPTPESPPTDEASPDSTPTPTPSPSDVSDVTHSNIDFDEDNADESSGGMSSAKKAGIVVGVIAAVCLVGLGGIVYKKRQNNIRRSEYGYAARREIL